MQLYARHLRRATPFEIDRSIEEFEEIMVPLMDDLGPAYFDDVGAARVPLHRARC